MNHLFRLIDNGIVDFFVQKAEDPGYCRDKILKNAPYLLSDRDLDGLPGYFPEESSDCLIIAEAPGNRKDIILQTTQCRGSYLGCEACTLAFAESEIGLAVLEHDFKRPTSGVDLPRLNKIEVGVSGEQSVPFAVLCPAREKDSDRYASKDSIVYDMVALEFAAVLQQLEFLAEFYRRRGGEIAMLRVIFCPAVLADLYHAQPMALYMTAVNETDNVLVGEPAVRQDTAKPYAFAYRPLYHLFGKFELGHVVCFFALPQDLAVMLRLMTALKFFGAHPVVALLPLFSDYVEVKENLRHTVCHSHAKALEADNGFMRQMGVNPSDFLYCAPCLLMVSVIENQADIMLFVVGAYMDTVPKLHGYVPQCLAPVDEGIFHKTVENILAGLYKRFKRAVLVATPAVSYPEAWEENQDLEHGQQRVDAVALACDRKRVSLGHPDLGKNRRYVLHCCCHIGIFEKRFDIREKWRNFVYRHGLEFVFLVVLKITQFLPIRQETMSFFYAIISGISYLRNLNKEHLEPYKESFQDYRIASFCENNPNKNRFAVQNTLMWAHYAAEHSGFCIEYSFDVDEFSKNDFSNNTASRLFRMKYRDPATEPVDFSTPDNTLFTDVAFLTKSIDWSYENEVRLIQYAPKKGALRNQYALSSKSKIVAIYFGARCPEANIQIIKRLLRDRDIRFYRMSIDFSNVHRLKPNEI